MLKSRISRKEPPLPTETSIAKICSLLTKHFTKEEKLQKYAPVKEVLALLGRGAILSAALLVPKSASALKPFLAQSPDRDAWKRFNISYLQRTLRRLEQNKQIEIIEENGQQIIHLTKNGKRKILKYSLENLTIEKPKHWDGKWRLVLYDVPVSEKKLGDIIRQALKTLGFYAIQNSAYLFPYPCFNQVEFLREYYGLGDKVQYMLVEHIERDQAFKIFFHLS